MDHCLKHLRASFRFRWKIIAPSALVIIITATVFLSSDFMSIIDILWHRSFKQNGLWLLFITDRMNSCIWPLNRCILMLSGFREKAMETSVASATLMCCQVRFYYLYYHKPLILTQVNYSSTAQYLNRPNQGQITFPFSTGQQSQWIRHKDILLMSF